MDTSEVAEGHGQHSGESNGLVVFALEVFHNPLESRLRVYHLSSTRKAAAGNHRAAPPYVRVRDAEPAPCGSTRARGLCRARDASPPCQPVSATRHRQGAAATVLQHANGCLTRRPSNAGDFRCCCKEGGGRGADWRDAQRGSAAPLGACDARLQHRVFRLLEAHSHPSSLSSPRSFGLQDEPTSIANRCVFRTCNGVVRPYGVGKPPYGGKCPEHPSNALQDGRTRRSYGAQRHGQGVRRLRGRGHPVRRDSAWPCEHASCGCGEVTVWRGCVQGGCEGAAFDRERRGRGARCGPVVPRRRADSADCLSAWRRRQACRTELFARRQRSTRRITGARACMRARACALAFACLR